jgi:hypothetical protein
MPRATEAGCRDCAQIYLARGARNVRVDDVGTLPNEEGAGNAGCALHPRPPVQQESTGVSNQGYTATTGIPCTMVLTVSFVLFPVTGLFCHRHSQDAQRVFANLAPASGRQNHTTSPSACSVIRLMTCRVHRIPLPTSVTIASRPSYGCGMRER